MLNYINLLCLLTGEGRHSRGKSYFTINNELITNFTVAHIFKHFLKHLFLPITGKPEEPNMGLPILGSQYLVNYSIWDIQNYRWLEEEMGHRKEEPLQQYGC